MNLFDILDNDNRVLVHANANREVIITWDKSMKLQSWKWIPAFDNEVHEQDTWEEVRATSLAEIPASYELARHAAISWAATAIW